ncbi:alpha/beta hydrolase [Roseomonas sp. BN140053]|uniref:alpha/beta hydrolase n=1 Tax=Roseomonas sp. BN140053 TaxID=3391898 RepID=UPI0039ED7C14
MTSLRATLLISVLRLLRAKRWLDDPERFWPIVRRLAEKGPAEPGRRRERALLIRRERVAGHLVFVAGPREGGSGARLLFLHGGAYVLHLQSVHWRLIEDLVSRTGATVVAPIYPLAPGAGWHEISALVRTVYDGLVAERGAEAVSVLGDSAGGGLTLAFAMALRDAGVPLPRRLVLLSPWLDVSASGPGQPALDRRDPLLGLHGAKEVGRVYARASGMAPEDPRVSPLFGRLAGLPPILLLTGTRDILNAEAHRLHAAARAEGAPLSLREYPEMIHDWMTLPLPEGRRALDEVAAFLA